MKRWLVVVMMFVCGAAYAQDPRADVHNALRQLRATMEKALNERDVNTILANVTPGIIFTTMNGDVTDGRDQLKAYFDRMMTGPGHIVQSISTHFEPATLTTMYGDDTGISYGTSNDHYVLTTGQKFDIRARWTCTLVKMNGRWLIASFHYSASIFENPILDKMRAMLMAGGAVGVALALILGIVVGRATKKAAA